MLLDGGVSVVVVGELVVAWNEPHPITPTATQLNYPQIYTKHPGEDQHQFGGVLCSF